MSDRKLNEVVADALEAFWAKIAESYPAAKTGDLPPEVVFELDQAAEKAVEVWVDWNVPKQQ